MRSRSPLSPKLRSSNHFRGTLEARPVTPTTSRIVYTLLFDNSRLPDDAARTADKERRRTRFMQALQNMKALAEGGKINGDRGCGQFPDRRPEAPCRSCRLRRSGMGPARRFGTARSPARA